MSLFKKSMLVLMLVAVVATSVALVGACNDKDGEDLPNIESIKAEVKLDDGTTRAVETVKAIYYDLSVLKLDAGGKFTEAGEYNLPVRYSDWTTTVVIEVTEA